jgi:hypothetical protein
MDSPPFAKCHHDLWNLRAELIDACPARNGSQTRDLLLLFAMWSRTMTTNIKIRADQKDWAPIMNKIEDVSRSLPDEEYDSLSADSQEKKLIDIAREYMRLQYKMWSSDDNILRELPLRGTWLSNNDSQRAQIREYKPLIAFTVFAIVARLVMHYYLHF